MALTSAKQLTVYQKSYDLAMRAFHLSRNFPVEERYCLTSQLRRCSRSVCLNLREAWAKRRYHDHFLAKMSDCDAENSETDTCVDFAKDCGYISPEQHEELTGLCREIGCLIGTMIKHPEQYLLTTDY
jgi:four helix bundle protein